LNARAFPPPVWSPPGPLSISFSLFHLHIEAEGVGVVRARGDAIRRRQRQRRSFVVRRHGHEPRHLGGTNIQTTPQPISCQLPKTQNANLERQGPGNCILNALPLTVPQDRTEQHATPPPTSKVPKGGLKHSVVVEAEAEAQAGGKGGASGASTLGCTLRLVTPPPGGHTSGAVTSGSPSSSALPPHPQPPSHALTSD
jgi:hypothetical protein